jgi:hypothetical protein
VVFTPERLRRSSGRLVEGARASTPFGRSPGALLVPAHAPFLIIFYQPVLLVESRRAFIPSTSATEDRLVENAVAMTPPWSRAASISPEAPAMASRAPFNLPVQLALLAAHRVAASASDPSSAALSQSLLQKGFSGADRGSRALSRSGRISGPCTKISPPLRGRQSGALGFAICFGNAPTSQAQALRVRPGARSRRSSSS